MIVALTGRHNCDHIDGECTGCARQASRRYQLTTVAIIVAVWVVILTVSMLLWPRPVDQLIWGTIVPILAVLAAGALTLLTWRAVTHGHIVFSNRRLHFRFPPRRPPRA